MHTENPLKVHEWLAITTIIGILTLLTIISLVSKKNVSMPPNMPVDEIEVFVEGAVANPGIYRVKQGTIVDSVISQAQPTDQADTRRIKKESKLRKGQVIKVPYKSKRRTKKSSQNNA